MATKACFITTAPAVETFFACEKGGTYAMGYKGSWEAKSDEDSGSSKDSSHLIAVVEHEWLWRGRLGVRSSSRKPDSMMVATTQRKKVAIAGL